MIDIADFSTCVKSARQEGVLLGVRSLLTENISRLAFPLHCLHVWVSFSYVLLEYSSEQLSHILLDIASSSEYIWLAAATRGLFSNMLHEKSSSAKRCSFSSCICRRISAAVDCCAVSVRGRLSSFSFLLMAFSRATLLDAFSLSFSLVL